MKYFIKDPRVPFICTSHHTSFPNHFHFETEFIYMMKGWETIRIGDSEFRLEEGQIYIAFPFVEHKYICPQRNVVLMCIFPPMMTPEYSNIMLSNDLECPIVDTRKLCPGFVDSLFRFHDYFNSEKSDEIVVKNMLSSLVGEMLGAAKLRERSGNHSLEKISRYVMENFDDAELTLASTAGALGFNDTYLSHIFTSTMKVSFVGFVNSFRVNKARHLLKYTNMGMNDIVSSCGFGSQRTFNRVFREFTDMSPSEFRASDIKLQL